MIDDNLEEKYLSEQCQYYLEKKIFSAMKTKDLKDFILDKFIEYKILSILIDNKFKLLKLIYENLSELESYYLEKYFFTFDFS